MRSCIPLVCFIFLSNLSEVLSHGRLADPPTRGSAWRYGFNITKDYADNAKFCGGKKASPRDNECPNGKYCSKVIVRTYSVGKVIDVKVEITMNDNGYFVFRVCPVTDESREECLNRHELVVEGTNSSKFEIPRGKTGYISTRIRLPNGLFCERCVFQWDYRAANDSDGGGQCSDGSYKVECGPQATFRGCVDIKIGSGNSINSGEVAHFATRTPISDWQQITNNKNGCKSANKDPQFDSLCENKCVAK